MRFFRTAIISGALLSQVAIASAAPAGLLNKTIRTSFAVTIPAKGADGSTLNGARSVSKTIYVSSAGRVFVSSSRREGRHSNQTESGPEVTGNAVRFDGNKLIGTLLVGNGASQLIVSFDSGFQSCTAQIITGGQGGRPMTWTGLNGIKYTSTGPASASSPSCSIQDGNAFAG
jgi:hypothetical protein